MVDVVDVSKKYCLNTGTQGYGLQDLFRELTGKAPSQALRQGEFWAVHHVSFRLRKGDTLALVGKNGSGKTTLLKMLSGLIKPDTGRIEIRGQVQSLINLQAGFNPDLSGRENVFSNGSIVGMRKKDISAVMEQIVDFAELGDFIDSPVASYSSGMKARLGFAVSAFMNPDVLLIDEVLAVGDHAFKNKCFKRIEELKSAGVIIIFVSHSESQVIKVCRDAVWIEKARLRMHGSARDVVAEYLRHLEEEEMAKGSMVTRTNPSSSALYGAMYVKEDYVERVTCRITAQGEETNTVFLHDEMVIEIQFSLKTRVTALQSTVNIYRDDGLKVAVLASPDQDRFAEIKSGNVTYKLRVADVSLAPGKYLIVLPISDGQQYLWRGIVREFFIISHGKLISGLVDLKHEYTVAASHE